MRLLGVEHKTVWGGGQVMLLNLLSEWQRAGEHMEPLLVCPPDAALLEHAREAGVACVPMPLGAVEKTRVGGVEPGTTCRTQPATARNDARNADRESCSPTALLFLASVFAAKLGACRLSGGNTTQRCPAMRWCAA